MHTHFNCNISILQNTLILKKVRNDSANTAIQGKKFNPNFLEWKHCKVIKGQKRRKKWLKTISLECSTRQFCGGRNPEEIDLGLTFISLPWHYEIVTQPLWALVFFNHIKGTSICHLLCFNEIQNDYVRKTSSAVLDWQWYLLNVDCYYIITLLQSKVAGKLEYSR